MVPYLWRWFVNLELLEVHVLNEVYTLELSIWTASGWSLGGRADLFGGRRKMTGAWRTWTQSVSKKRGKFREFSGITVLEFGYARRARLAWRQKT